MRRVLALAALCSAAAWSYPLDGFDRTGIRRLNGYQKLMKLPAGAMMASDQVKLRLWGSTFDINGQTPRDPYLQAGLEKIFAARDPSYHIAVLDISETGQPRYAVLRGDEKLIPGSVGKLLVATGLFGQLAKLYPSDFAARERMLKQTVVTADSFVYTDGKTVPFYNPGDARIVNRRIEAGDKFNLWEWLDHMLSQSSNAAGSMVWKQDMLLEQFGARYPVSSADEAAFFKQAPRKELADLSLNSIETTMKAAGLDPNRLRIGTFFTRNASRVVPGTASYGTPNELLRWLIKIEQGKLVDAWSSLEIKKLMYFTRPRYRYSSSPALSKAAVFFKSGSLFECDPGTPCAQYKGTKLNLMHSVAIVESGSKIYLVAMMSNVLKLNSAIEHQTIATEIEKLILSRPAR